MKHGLRKTNANAVGIKNYLNELSKIKNMVEKHRHCINCGISIPPNEYFCSRKCEIEFNSRRRKAMMLQWFLFAMLFFVFMILILASAKS